MSTEEPTATATVTDERLAPTVRRDPSQRWWKEPGMSVDSDALQERTRGAHAALWRLAGPWWLFLLTGLAWLIIAWVVLRFTPASVATVGVLLGVLSLLAMIDEFVIAPVHSSWRWLHVVMGIIFAFGAGWLFARPYDAVSSKYEHAPLPHAHPSSARPGQLLRARSLVATPQLIAVASGSADNPLAALPETEPAHTGP
jgi:hypothetical protein